MFCLCHFSAKIYSVYCFADIAGLGSMVFSPALSHDFMQRLAFDLLFLLLLNH